MKIFIDFDDVLLNTRRFRRDYVKIYVSCGISSEIFEKYYKKAIKYNKSIILYDPEKHLNELEKGIRCDVGELKRSVYKFARNSKNYVFKDVQNFLSRFKKRDIFIISHSKSKFQKVKLENSGLKKFANKIIQTGKLKFNVINDLVKKDIIRKSEIIYFLDDRVEQINGIKKNYPYITTILIRRREGRYKDKKTKYCDFVARNIREAQKIIQNY